MAKALTQQMNIRIDSTLKAEGDSVFASLGMSPSEAVRALYEAAVRYRYDVAKLRLLLTVEGEQKAVDPDVENPKLKLAREGREIVEKARKRLGISEEAMREVAKIPDRELLEEALYERLVERGLA